MNIQLFSVIAILLIVAAVYFTTGFNSPNLVDKESITVEEIYNEYMSIKKRDDINKFEKEDLLKYVEYKKYDGIDVSFIGTLTKMDTSSYSYEIELIGDKKFFSIECTIHKSDADKKMIYSLHYNKKYNVSGEFRFFIETFDNKALFNLKNCLITPIENKNEN